MNKELWGKATDLPSHFVTHFSTPWGKKKKNIPPIRRMHHSINAAAHESAHRAAIPLHFPFLSLPRLFFFFLISARSRSVAFSPLYIYSILHLRRVSSFLLSFLLSPLSRSRAGGWARGSRYTKARHRHTHKDTTRT